MHLNSEWIDLLKKLMIASAKKGNLPNSGLVIEGNDMIASAESWVISNRDATAHSERILVETVGKLKKSNFTPGLKMVSVVESCAMCMSACSQAGYKEIFYIIPAKKYIKKVPWMSDTETIDKIALARSFSNPVSLIHLPQYEEEFSRVFEDVYKEYLK